MNTVIETPRLFLCTLRESDHADLYEFLAQLEDDEFEGYPGITFENNHSQLDARIDSDEFLAMERKDNGKVIGNIYRGRRDFEGIEVGYIVNAYDRRQGYAAEALSAVVKDAFHAGVHRIYAECDPLNERSWRLLEAVGFRREACLRQNIFFHHNTEGKPIWKYTYIYALMNGEDKVR